MPKYVQDQRLAKLAVANLGNLSALSEINATVKHPVKLKPKMACLEIRALEPSSISKPSTYVSNKSVLSLPRAPLYKVVLV